MKLYIATISGDPGRMVRFVTPYDDEAFRWLREIEAQVRGVSASVFEVEANEYLCDGEKIFCTEG